MIYKYMGKEVEVLRFTENGTAQLADGNWVSSSILIPIEEKKLDQDALAEAAKNTRAKRGENN